MNIQAMGNLNDFQYLLAFTPCPAPTASSQCQAAREKGPPPCCTWVLCQAAQVVTPWSLSTDGPHCGPCCTGGDWGTGTESRGDLLTLGPAPCQEHVAQSSPGQLGSRIDRTPVSGLPPGDAFISHTNSFHFRTPVRPAGGWGALPHVWIRNLRPRALEWPGQSHLARKG